MAIELYDAVDHDGLFDLLGKAFHAIDVLNTARGTTVPAGVLATIEQFKLLTSTLGLQPVVDGLADATTSNQSQADSLAQSLQNYCQQLLIEMADADTPLAAKTLENALALLIDQMRANSQSVDASTVSESVTVGASNIGNGRIVFTSKRAGGLQQENQIPETITATVATSVNPGAATLQLSTAAAARNLLAEDWPAGSGAGGSLLAGSPATGLLTNGEFDDDTDEDNVPDGWQVSVGTIGTTIKMTVNEIQTVAISGTPTGGTYTLSVTNIVGKVQTTDDLTFDASASSVQAAIAALDGFQDVTVTATGTSPNLTHSVTFNGVGGNLAIMSSTNLLTGGTPVITHGTTTQGTSQVFSGGKALWFLSDGAQLTTINQKLSGLSPQVAYAISLWAMADVVPAAGVITIDLVDGIGGTVINDDQGTANSITFNATALSDTVFKHLTALVSGSTECVFRTPTNLPPLVYLRIRISTAVTSTRSVFFDRASLVALTEIYPGGPLLAAFSGAADFVFGDEFTITAANNRAGLLQEWSNRVFDMANQGLLLPSNAAGGETIPDSVVA